jgi:hypothetical protein
MVIFSADNQCIRGEETFHFIPFFDPSLVIIFLTALALGISVFAYLKLRKRKKHILYQ